MTQGLNRVDGIMLESTPLELSNDNGFVEVLLKTTENTEVAPPVWLVRLWPDHFSSRPDYNITCSVESTLDLISLICRLGNGICFSS